MELSTGTLPGRVAFVKPSLYNMSHWTTGYVGGFSGHRTRIETVMRYLTGWNGKGSILAGSENVWGSIPQQST